MHARSSNLPRSRLHATMWILVAVNRPPNRFLPVEKPMTLPASVILTGHTGRSYIFTVIPIGSPLASIGMVYALLSGVPGDGFGMRRSLMRLDPPRSSHSDWTVLYIGQADDLRARFENAQIDPDLARICDTHLAVLEADSDPQRRAIEADLVPRYASLLARLPCSSRKSLVEFITIAHRSA